MDYILSFVIYSKQLNSMAYIFYADTIYFYIKKYSKIKEYKII